MERRSESQKKERLLNFCRTGDLTQITKIASEDEIESELLVPQSPEKMVDSLLCVAIIHSHVEVVRFLFAYGKLDVNALLFPRFGTWISTFNFACQMYSTSLARLLLDLGANPNEIHSPSKELKITSYEAVDTPLLFAIRNGLTSMFELFLEKTPAEQDWNVPCLYSDSTELTPLLLAIKYQRSSIVRDLVLKKKIAITCFPHSRFPLPQFVIFARQPEKAEVEEIFELKRINAGFYPLIACAYAGESVKLLVEQGAPTIYQTPFSDCTSSPCYLNALCHVIQQPHFRRTDFEDLLAHGADLRTADSVTFGLPPLHLAALNSNLVAVQLLLQHGADPNQVVTEPSFGAWTSLFQETFEQRTVTPLEACMLKNYQSVEIVQELLKAGATLGNALAVALAHNSWPEVIQTLIDHGADLFSMPQNGNHFNHLQLAIKHNRPRVIQDVVMQWLQNEEHVGDIEEMGLWKLAVDANLRTEKRVMDTFNILSEFNVPGIDTSYQGETALMAVCRTARKVRRERGEEYGKSLFQALLLFGADPSNALFLAVLSLSPDMVELMVSREKIATKSWNDQGEHIFHFAVRKSSIDVVQALISAGVTKELTDEDRWKVLQILFIRIQRPPLVSPMKVPEERKSLFSRTSIPSESHVIKYSEERAKNQKFQKRAQKRERDVQTGAEIMHVLLREFGFDLACEKWIQQERVKRAKEFLPWKTSVTMKAIGTHTHVFSLLPREILLNVMNLMSVRQINRLRCVNSWWYLLANDPMLWRIKFMSRYFEFPIRSTTTSEESNLKLKHEVNLHFDWQSIFLHSRSK